MWSTRKAFRVAFICLHIALLCINSIASSCSHCGLLQAATHNYGSKCCRLLIKMQKLSNNTFSYLNITKVCFKLCCLSINSDVKIVIYLTYDNVDEKRRKFACKYKVLLTTWTFTVMQCSFWMLHSAIVTSNVYAVSNVVMCGWC